MCEKSKKITNIFNSKFQYMGIMFLFSVFNTGLIVIYENSGQINRIRESNNVNISNISIIIL